VSQNLPSVTVVIAARPGQAEIQAVTAARKLDYPGEKLEIIVARGRQPSVQRNAAMRAAAGELIYFLDDDSVPPPDNLRRAAGLFADPKVRMAGGPNICPDDAPFLERVFALVHASWLAFGPSRARYSAVGALRESSEKELILCNLIARRDPMLELGGFNEALYPNEENALMDELQKRGGKLLYDPRLIVYRRPRRTLKSFCRMLLNYGRGRAEQFRVYPTLGSAANLVPPLFCVYLVVALVLGSFGLATEPWRSLVWAPLALYGVVLFVQAVMLVPQGGVAASVCAIPLMLLTHLVYGIGFWRGLFTRLHTGAGAQRPEVKVVLETVRL
jgi:cellulose synthase/poly-beta-1,6-N-acetylglucosamine synthase-like glycosyltransferase